MDNQLQEYRQTRLKDWLNKHKGAPLLPVEEDEKVILAPLKISGPISLQTPIDVLIEIAQMSSFNRDIRERIKKNYFAKERLSMPSKRLKVVNLLNGVEPLSLTSPLTEKTLPHLVRYVNPDEKWTVLELTKSYERLHKQAGDFSKLDGGPLPLFRKLVDNKELGLPRPKIKTTTISFLYRAASWLGIPTTFDLDPSDILNLVKTYLSCGNAALLSSYFMIRNLRMPEIIIPNTRETALKLAASNHDLDLSWLKDPILSYLELVSKGEIRALKELRRRNPELGKLGHVFEPQLLSVYNNLRRSPFSEDINTNLLKVSLNNFWEGWFPTITNVETPFSMERVEDLGPEDVICFGVVKEKLTAFSFNEIADFMEAQDVPSTFLNGSVQPLNKEQIDLLLSICNSQTGDSKTKIRIKLSLLRMIDGVTAGDAVVTKLITSYAEPKFRTTISDFLELIFKLGMVMRGWNPRTKTPYPLAETRGPEGDHSVEVRTQKNMGKVIALANENKDLKLLDLPMLQYLDSSFQRYNRQEGGRTLGDRLNIVQFQTDNIHSCIRMASGLLLWTSLYYMEKVGMKLPVKIEEIRSVA